MSEVDIYQAMPSQRTSANGGVGSGGKVSVIELAPRRSYYMTLDVAYGGQLNFNRELAYPVYHPVKHNHVFTGRIVGPTFLGNSTIVALVERRTINADVNRLPPTYRSTYGGVAMTARRLTGDIGSVTIPSEGQIYPTGVDS